MDQIPGPKNKVKRIRVGAKIKNYRGRRKRIPPQQGPKQNTTDKKGPMFFPNRFEKRNHIPTLEAFPSLASPLHSTEKNKTSPSRETND